MENIKAELGRKLSTESTPAAIAQNNRTFVEKLLKVSAPFTFISNKHTPSYSVFM